MNRTLLQQALDALDAITDDVDGTGLNTMPSFDKAIDAIAALREALAQPEPIDGFGGNLDEAFEPAPPAAPAPADLTPFERDLLESVGQMKRGEGVQVYPPAPAVPAEAALNTLARLFHNGEEIEGDDGAAMMVDLSLWHEASEAFDSLIGDGDGETLASSAAPAVPRSDEFACPYCFDQGAAPAVREPIIDEMDAVASRYAHKLALDLECVLSDYNGKWWDTAMQTIGEYRMAMNRIHERESPTHMGEPVLPKHGIGGGGK